jgi:hypothetical protein
MKQEAKPQGGDVFIVDNSDTDWKVRRYLHDWADIAKAFDIATGYFEIGSLLGLDGQWQKLPLQPQPTLDGKYSQIFSRRLLAPKWYEVPEAELVEKLQKEWSDFVEKDLRSIVSAMKDGLALVHDASTLTLVEGQATSPESGNEGALASGTKTEASG